MKNYEVEWAEYNKNTTEYKEEYDSEFVKAENEPEAIELIKQYILGVLISALNILKEQKKVY